MKISRERELELMAEGYRPAAAAAEKIREVRREQEREDRIALVRATRPRTPKQEHDRAVAARDATLPPGDR